MTAPEPNSDRLILFTDAVCAIAITLLILPLVDIVPEAVQGHEPLGTLLGEHIGQFGSFALSFLVIYRLWWAHHQLFRHVTAINARLVQWSILWTFAIVFLPLPTAIITAYRPQPGTIALYGCTLVVASSALLAAALTIRRHPELSAGAAPISREELLGSVTALGTEVLAVIVGCLFADTINFWAFLLMLLSGPVEAIVQRSWRNRDRARNADRPEPAQSAER